LNVGLSARSSDAASGPHDDSHTAPALLIKAVNGIEIWRPSRMGEAERDGIQDHRRA
jgi:hypothetical protein